MHDPIQFLWVGPSLSRLEQLSLASFVYHGHDVHLYAYDDVGGIPDGVTIKDGNEIVPELGIFRQSHKGEGQGSLGAFSDYFRWRLLLERGGFWCDTDIICIQPFRFNDDLVFGKESETVANGAVFGITPGHQFSRQMCEVIDNPFKIYPWDRKKDKRRKWVKRVQGKTHLQNIRFGDIGPKLITNLTKHMGVFDQGKPFTYFYPVHYDNWESIFNETFKNDDSLFTDTYALHFWNEMTRRMPGFDKNADFPKTSLIEKLRSKYQP
jgi:hypothetical protein|tara:strand:+ start:1066 stop:1863 length:798 start_codon:yes stop_codon:yes gene_type:complete